MRLPLFFRAPVHPHRPRRRPQPLGLEILEDRHLLNGMVVAFELFGTVAILGDDNLNGIAITAGSQPGQLVVTGTTTTQPNGATLPTWINADGNTSRTFDGVASVLIVVGHGGWQLSMTNCTLPSVLNISYSDPHQTAANTFRFDGLTVQGNATIVDWGIGSTIALRNSTFAGPFQVTGYESHEIDVAHSTFGNTFNLLAAGRGLGRLAVSDSTFAGNVTVATQGHIVDTSLVNSEFDGRLDLSLWNGDNNLLTNFSSLVDIPIVLNGIIVAGDTRVHAWNDSLTVVASAFSGNFHFDGDDGDKHVTIWGGDFLGNFEADLNGGNDSVVLVNSTFWHQAKFDGGGGFNTYRNVLGNVFHQTPELDNMTPIADQSEGLAAAMADMSAAGDLAALADIQVAQSASGGVTAPFPRVGVHRMM
jgi:hypothetical protein